MIRSGGAGYHPIFPEIVAHHREGESYFAGGADADGDHLLMEGEEVCHSNWNTPR